LTNNSAKPDFERAKAYALGRLQELPPVLTYHGIGHTRDHVVPAAEQLAALEGCSADDLALLSTSAWFHDLGYLERHDDNEVIAVRMAQDILPKLNYSPQHIQVISGIIMATRLPQTPHTQLESIIADADLSTLGHKDFLKHESALRQEFSQFGRIYDDKAWFSYQLEFLQQHQYFSPSAHRCYDEQKRLNIAAVEKLLAEASHGSP